jgi:hypothetical protein
MTLDRGRYMGKPGTDLGETRLNMMGCPLLTCSAEQPGKNPNPLFGARGATPD